MNIIINLTHSNKINQRAFINGPTLLEALMHKRDFPVNKPIFF